MQAGVVCQVIMQFVNRGNLLSPQTTVRDAWIDLLAKGMHLER